MNELVRSLRGIKCPTIAPTYVQCAPGAVKISADPVPFSFVACKVAVFPDAGEFFELERRHLMVRRVGGLFLLVDEGRARHRPATRAENAFRILLIRPPKHLVEPVRAPVAECSVRIIEEIAPATGMELCIERTQRR